MNTLNERLDGLSKLQVCDLFSRLNGGRLGFDAARVAKSDIITRLMLAHGEADIEAALRLFYVAPAAPVAGAAPAAATGDAAAMIAQAVALLAAQAAPAAPVLDADMVRALVREEVGQVAPRVIEVRREGVEAVRLEGHQHPMFDTVLRAAAAGLNVLLVGPAGCGKTHLAQSVARALNKSFASISGSAGVSEAQLVGRLLPTGDGGRFEYVPSPFVREYTSGGVFLFDELDAFDPNCLLVVNSALANGGFDVEARAASGLPTHVARDPGAVLIGSANTYGTGAGAMYVGRSQLDAATLDRWFTIEMDYDRDYEQTITSNAELLSFVWKLREGIAEHKLRRVASSRMIAKGATALAAGLRWSMVRERLTAGWTREELAKVGA